MALLTMMKNISQHLFHRAHTINAIHIYIRLLEAPAPAYSDHHKCPIVDRCNHHTPSTIGV